MWQPDFWKKFLIWRYSQKGHQISPKSDTFIFGRLVDNAVFSETALTISLIFGSKLGDYKGRKVTEPDVWKKLLIWRYLRKGLQISPKSDTFIFFSKTALMIFLVFGLKLVLNMTFNLNETYFSEKFAIWRYLTSKLSNFGLGSKLHNSRMADPFFFFFFISKVSIQVPLSYECNSFYSKIAISNIFDLKDGTKTISKLP